MMLVMDKTQVEQPADGILDLENGTWTCVSHGTVMRLDSRKDCADCLRTIALPDSVPRWMVDSLVS